MTQGEASVRFVLVAEGTSDAGLVPVLRDLCVRVGAVEAIGEYPRLEQLQHKVGRRHAVRVKAALELLPDTNLVFVHRDADARHPDDVHREIEAALVGTGLPRHVAVVPVRETEAWLLCDEQAIRDVVGNPHGTADLLLPKLKRVEDVADPKELLREAIAIASELTGRRREQILKDFPRYRRDLLTRLDPDGAVQQLPAWKRLVHDLTRAVESLSAK